ncbi:MAG: hypothetical protein ABI780_12820, partial [Ardenticatenales bacterium]
MVSTDGSTRPGMRRLLFIAGVLVAIAGIQLFVMTEHTAAYFAWTIAPPKNLYLTAAFVGAAYWASACLEIVAARETDWSVLRLSIPAVFTFTSLTLVYTLIHIDLFHLGPPLGAPATGMALVAGWAWLIVYVAVPPWLSWQWWKQARAFADRAASGGADARGDGTPAAAAIATDVPSAPHSPIPPMLLRALLALQAAVMGGVGVALFLRPSLAPSLWPWALTPLTARSIAAWLMAFAVAAVTAVRANDLRRVRGPIMAYLALGVLQLVAVARYAGEVDWASAGMWVYTAFLVSVVG